MMTKHTRCSEVYQQCWELKQRESFSFSRDLVLPQEKAQGHQPESVGDCGGAAG